MANSEPVRTLQLAWAKNRVRFASKKPKTRSKTVMTHFKKFTLKIPCYRNGAPPHRSISKTIGHDIDDRFDSMRTISMRSMPKIDTPISISIRSMGGSMGFDRWGIDGARWGRGLDIDRWIRFRFDGRFDGDSTPPSPSIAIPLI